MAGHVQEITIEIPNLRPLPANNTKRIVTNRKTKRPVIVDTVKGRARYVKAIRFHAEMAAAREDWWPENVAVEVEYVFSFQRPKCHFGTGRNAGKVKPSAPADHLVKPDAVNLIKPVEDVLTGILWSDDCQAVRVVSRKVWSVDNRESVVIVARRVVGAGNKNGKGNR